ncbi:AAA family ATPase [Comamonas sp. lk]|uniref:AAA family ATPase n=1 Tax=Comamonas sp. lk TaxID=2201272 RepID=UPI000EB528C5|nr:AAA family ATPase [Comamonas sp. lk]
MPDMHRLDLLASAFSPSAPIDNQSLFSGRISQLTDVLNAVNQKGQHAILFGERGVGKTSLARVISSGISIRGKRTIVGAINCDQTMTFDSLWRKIFREIVLSINQKNPDGTTDNIDVSFLGKLPTTQLTPDDIRHILSRLPKTIVVIDELDRITSQGVTTALADTIKTLSDHAIDSTVLLVGVADSVDSLIKEHESIERALVQIRMPRMSKDELTEIIKKGLNGAQMTITDDACNGITALSQGLPHYTHLLTQSAGQNSATNDRTEVTEKDVRAAIDKALSKAQQSIISAHHKATNSPRENLYPQVLLACSLAEQDGLGYFAAVDVRAPLSKIMHKAYEIPAFSQHLNAFCEPGRGPVLQRTGTTRRYRFRFINPLLQPFVLMDGIKKELISPDELKNIAQQKN